MARRSGMIMTDGVVLLHGIARRSTSMNAMQRALEAAGYAVLNLDYPSRHLPLAALADTIHAAVARFGEAVPGATHVVAHSMGGLLIRAYLARQRPVRLGRVVMIGTPNGGSEIADVLGTWPLYELVFGPAGQQLGTHQDPAFAASLGTVDYPLGIIAGNRPLIRRLSSLFIAGPNDGKVSVASTRISGMADHLVVPASHTWLIRHPAAIRATMDFLRDGRFPVSPA